MDDQTLVCTYGTLKRGFPNHKLIQDLILSNDATFLSTCLTVDPLPLVVGPNGIPFLINLPGSGHRVSGELYSFSAAGIARIDALEGTDRGHYERLPIKVIAGEGSDEKEAEAYYAHRSYAEEMWRRSGENGIRVYSEEDAVGYVKPEKRPRDSTFLGEIRIFLASDSRNK